MNNKKRGFSLVGLLVLLAVAAVAIVLTASVMTRRHHTKDDEVGSATHGTYVCYLDDAGSPHEVAIVDGQLKASRSGCNLNADESYIPKSAKNFNVTLIGGGGGGAKSGVPEINDNYLLARKNFLFEPPPAGEARNIDFNTPYSSDNNVINLYSDFIQSIEIQNLRVEGGGGANAVLTGLGGGDVGNVLNGMEEGFQDICSFFSGLFGGSECKIDNIHISGVNHCRCTNEYDGNVNPGPHGHEKIVEKLEAEITGNDFLDFFLKVKQNWQFLTERSRGSISDSWDWTNYSACYSPQCKHGRGSAEYCNAIDDSADKSYSVAARGGDGGVCVLKKYNPSVGDILTYQAGKGGKYNPHFKKAKQWAVQPYQSKGGDGFIRVTGRNGNKELIATGGDAPQYRQVENKQWLGLNTYANCPVHASVANCGNQPGGNAHMCDAKENYGAGKCESSGFSDTEYVGTHKVTRSHSSPHGETKTFKSLELTAGNGALGEIKRTFGGTEVDVVAQADGGPGRVSPGEFRIENQSRAFKNVYTKVFGVRVILKDAQAGTEGKVRDFILPKLQGAIDIQLGRGGQGATAFGTDGEPGQPTSITVNNKTFTADGGFGGKILVKDLQYENSNTITFSTHDGENGSNHLYALSNSVYNKLFSGRALVQSDPDNDASTSTYFGGSGAGSKWTMEADGVNLKTKTIDGAKPRLEYGDDDACTSCYVFKGVDRPSSIRYTDVNGNHVVTGSTPTYAVPYNGGNGGGGAVIITW